MSIWSSVNIAGAPPCVASNLYSDSTDNYRGAGREDVELDVATATSWNASVRLATCPVEPGDMEVSLLLSEASAEVLRDRLSVALKRIRSTRAHRGEAEERKP